MVQTSCSKKHQFRLTNDGRLTHLGCDSAGCFTILLTILVNYLRASHQHGNELTTKQIGIRWYCATNNQIHHVNASLALLVLAHQHLNGVTSIISRDKGPKSACGYGASTQACQCQ